MSERMRYHPGISPVLRPRIPPWRSHAMLFLVFLAFCGLLARAAWVQLLDSDFYVEQGRKRVERVLSIPAARGEIVDRNGRLLALSQPMRTVYAIPSAFDEPLPADRLKALADLLGMAPARLADRLYGTRQMVYLKRRVPVAVADKIAALNIPEVRLLEEWQRFYPDGAASAQVVGFADIDEVGQEGIEASQNTVLRPIAGRRTVVRNRLGEIVDDTPLDPPEPPRPGKQVRLTIDERIQHAAYESLRTAVKAHHANAGAAVVLDATNGEIVALANWPSFDPNNRAARHGASVRNRAVTDLFEPGSTIKPIHVAAALQRGRVKPGTTFVTAPGWLQVGRFTVRDTLFHERLSVGDILRYSSNVGMVRMTRNETQDAMWRDLRGAGFGSAPDVPLSGIAAGSLREVARWSGTDQAALSYGYGVSVSLLQLAHAYTMFGTSGKLLPLSLVMDQPAMKRSKPSRVPTDDVDLLPGFSPATARQVRLMLESATMPGGTAHHAAVPGYSVAAKTGTTRKIEGRGYAARDYYATTVGLAPAHSPRYVVAVLIDTPRGTLRGGGAVAAPLFSSLMGEALRLSGVPPDQAQAAPDRNP